MRLIEKFSESIKVLNDYRNLYHAESSSTEQYKVAIAINNILPEFCRLIESDAEPVVHGHWEETGRFEKDGVNYICYRCSICGGLHRERRKQTGNPNSIGCPHCRAKMDEEEK